MTDGARPAWTVRAATDGDLAAVLDLWVVADAQPTHTDDLASLSRLVGHDPGALIVAEAADGRLVGTVVAGWDGWRGSIYRLVVAPDRRRQGVGQALLRRAEERLAAQGAARSAAIVVATEAEAVAFWEASGWERQTERLRFTTG